MQRSFIHTMPVLERLNQIGPDDTLLSDRIRESVTFHQWARRLRMAQDDYESMGKIITGQHVEECVELLLEHYDNARAQAANCLYRGVVTVGREGWHIEVAYALLIEANSHDQVRQGKARTLGLLERTVILLVPGEQQQFFQQFAPRQPAAMNERLL